MATLPKVCVWFDYVSIPQPAVEDAPARRRTVGQEDAVAQEMATSDHRVDAAATAAAESSSSHASHTEGAAARKAELVCCSPTRSTRSRATPSAARRCGAVPPTAHNRSPTASATLPPGARRWCRWNLPRLACGDEMPVMIIEGAAKPLVYFNPCDTFKLRSSRGAFPRRRPRRRQQDAGLDAAREGRLVRRPRRRDAQPARLRSPRLRRRRDVDALDADTPAAAGSSSTARSPRPAVQARRSAVDRLSGGSRGGATPRRRRGRRRRGSTRGFSRRRSTTRRRWPSSSPATTRALRRAVPKWCHEGARRTAASRSRSSSAATARG